MHEHVLILPDSKGAVSSLVLDSGVPPAVKVDNVRGRRQVEPGAAGLERKDKEWAALILLKGPDQILSLSDLRLSMQHETRSSEHAAEKGGKRPRRLPKLREDQRLLLSSGNDFCNIAQAAELAAILLIPGAVAQPLRVALTGRTTSPGIFDVLAVLGRDQCLARLGDQAAG